MASFDQFANQGGAAAGDESEAAAAQAAADELLTRSAHAADAADFGGGPLGAHPEPETDDDAPDDSPASGTGL